MAKETVDKNMTLGKVVQKFPQSAEIMMKYGLHCIGYHVSAFETVEQGAQVHGLGDKEISQMIKEINKSIGKR